MIFIMLKALKALKAFNRESLNKEPIWFKNPNNPSCVNLFLTNYPRYFQNTSTIETGISDFHKLVVTVLKIFYKKQKPKLFNTETLKLLTSN